MHADSSHRLLGLPAEKSSGFGNTNDPIMYRTAAVQLPPNSCRSLPRSGTAALQNRMSETAAVFRTPRALPLPRSARTPLPRSLSTPLRANKLFSHTLNNRSEHHAHHARTVHTPLLRVSNTPRNADMRLSRRSVHTPGRATVPGSIRLDALGQTLTHTLASSMCAMEALNAQTAAALGSPDSDYSVSSVSASCTLSYPSYTVPAHALAIIACLCLSLYLPLMPSASLADNVRRDPTMRADLEA